MHWTRTVALVAASACALGPLAVFAQTAPTPPSVVPVAPPHGARAFGTVNEEHILDAIRNGHIVGRQMVGSTSVNFHLHLTGDVDCAFKPRSQLHGEAYRAEIAAFHVNRMLGLSRVPPAVSRYVSIAQLHIGPEVLITPERDNLHVRGAAIYWVPVLRDSRIDQEHERQRWGAWLHQGNTIPAGEESRAEEISTLVTFDLLIGNWDRWSGQNVPMDAAGHLIYRDNNGGFDEPFVDSMLLGVMRHVRQVQKFSRGVIERARAWTEASVQAEMASDPDTVHPPLSHAQIVSLLRRRDTLTAYVDELIHRYGEASVYAWP